MIKPGAAVVDAGIHRGANDKLCGDVDFAAAREKAAKKSGKIVKKDDKTA